MTIWMKSMRAARQFLAERVQLDCFEMNGIIIVRIIFGESFILIYLFHFTKLLSRRNATFLLVNRNSSFDDCRSFSVHVSRSVAKRTNRREYPIPFLIPFPFIRVYPEKALSRKYYSGGGKDSQVHRNEVGAHSRKTEQVSR